jgi:hypothetical protein
MFDPALSVAGLRRGVLSGIDYPKIANFSDKINSPE